VRLLVDHRDDLVAERTRLESRIRWHLHEIAPDLTSRLAASSSGTSSSASPPAGLDRRVDRRHLPRAAGPRPRAQPPHQRTRTPNHPAHPRARPDAAEHPRLRRRPPPSSSAKPPAPRFRSKRAYARWNGTAPQPASSGNTTRFRLNRGGNRQVNAALHRIAPKPASGRKDATHHQTPPPRQHQSRSATPPPTPTLRRRLPGYERPRRDASLAASGLESSSARRSTGRGS
jgi:hypothetical protein